MVAVVRLPPGQTRLGLLLEIDGSAYDASQIAMRYSGQPAHHWHPAALLRVLAEACSTAPVRRSRRFRTGLERNIAVESAAARLGERGFDIDQLLRCVFKPMFVGEFVRLSSRVAYDLSRQKVAIPDGITRLGERILADIGAPDAEQSFSAYLQKVIRDPSTPILSRRMAGWVSVADLRSLLRWRLPSELEWTSLPELDFSPSICESQWLADRFLLTYVGDWHTASLHEEFRWARGTLRSSVSTENMMLRTLAPDRLNAEIALRTVDGDGSDPRSLLMAGVDFLQRGEHEQATALFQGALAVSPSAWVRNCLAFCLVPSDPAIATEMFLQLLTEDFNQPLLCANLAATSRLQHDIESAHAYARRGLEQTSDAKHSTAYLWGFEGGVPTLMADVSLHDYLRFVLSWE